MRKLIIFHKPPQICPESRFTLRVLNDYGIPAIQTDVTDPHRNKAMLTELSERGLFQGHYPILIVLDGSDVVQMLEEPKDENQILCLLRDYGFLPSVT